MKRRSVKYFKKKRSSRFWGKLYSAQRDYEVAQLKMQIAFKNNPLANVTYLIEQSDNAIKKLKTLVNIP